MHAYKMIGFIGHVYTYIFFSYCRYTGQEYRIALWAIDNSALNGVLKSHTPFLCWYKKVYIMYLIVKKKKKKKKNYVTSHYLNSWE